MRNRLRQVATDLLVGTALALVRCTQRARPAAAAMSDTDPRSRAHPNHPTFAHRAWMWAIDGMTDDIEAESWTDDDEQLADEIEVAIKDLLCKRYGHSVVDDQCGIPSHRYCEWCNKSMPDMPIGRVKP